MPVITAVEAGILEQSLVQGQLELHSKRHVAWGYSEMVS